jgi:hypothetical protein
LVDHHRGKGGAHRGERRCQWPVPRTRS